jgi:hypothetical protein
MTIFVPQHLRKIPLLGELCEIIKRYAEEYEQTSSSFDDYRSYMKIDPVKRFIGMCLNDYYQRIGGEFDEVALNYLTRLFYSVRGTYNVIVFSERYLGLQFESVSYTPRALSFILDHIIGNDVSLFDEYINTFYHYLLYSGDLNYKVKDLTVTIDESLSLFGGNGIVSYKRFNNMEVTE